MRYPLIDRGMNYLVSLHHFLPSCHRVLDKEIYMGVYKLWEDVLEEGGRLAIIYERIYAEDAMRLQKMMETLLRQHLSSGQDEIKLK